MMTRGASGEGSFLRKYTLTRVSQSPALYYLPLYLLIVVIALMIAAIRYYFGYKTVAKLN